MGSDLSTADEWLEIAAVPARTGAVMTQSLNLRGWSVTIQKDTGESVVATVGNDLFIGSGHHLVFSNYGAAQSRLSAEPALISTTMSLPNTKIQLRVRDAAGNLVDEVDDYVGAPFAGVNPSASSGLPKATMERLDLRRPGTDSTNWRTATMSLGFDADAVILGSPGFPMISTTQSSSSSSSSSQVLASYTVQPILSELLPDPSGTQEEWIEMANTGSTMMDLEGWSLHSGSRTFMFPAGTVLGPGEHRLFTALQTGLQLPNSGGDVQLRFGSAMFDHILYTETPDGISVGRGADASIGPFCVPTPGHPNTIVAPTISLVGFLPGQPNPMSLNLEVKALSGSIAGGFCAVDYGDGFVSYSCNPPSHAMKRTGHVQIKTEAKDFCGTTVIRQDDVLVVGGSSSKKPSSMTAIQSCMPTATGGLIVSEFLPAPRTGEEEWIELRNISDDTIDLCGWSVDDVVGGSHPYRLDHLRVDAGQYLLIGSKASGIALNNDADMVRLIAPNLRGGTGVLLSVPYQDANSTVSFSLRDDGLILPTPFPTPGTGNRFTAIDTAPGASPVILSAALPNPTGIDTWDEWIELTNVTGRPQWLNGWRIEDSAGHSIPLDGYVLSKRESQRIPLYKHSFVLVNNMDALRLIDDQGAIRSVIAWHDAEEGHVVRVSIDCSEQSFTVISIHDDLTIHTKTKSGIVVTLLIPGVMTDMHIPAINSDMKIETKNYLSALLKNKIIVLKKCSDGSTFLQADRADIALLLLEHGLVIADPVDDSLRHDVFMVYEDQARSQRRGIWQKMDNGKIVDGWKNDRTLDQTVATDDLKLIVSPGSSLLATGSVISVETNVPADLWVKQGTGVYRRFDGDVFIRRDTTLTFLAAYEYRTLSGGTVRTSVVSQSYAVRQSSYSQCLKINEVYPSPKKGEQEWVEIENICDDTVSLLGWTIDDVIDGGSKAFTFKTNSIVRAGQKVILSGALLPIALNNGGDSVVLSSPDGRIQGAMTYLKVAAGRAVALVGESYCLTIKPTAGLDNNCVQAVAKSKGKGGKGKVAKAMAGLGTKYQSSLLPLDRLNTENDQFKGFMEGLNRNSIYKEDGSDFRSYFAVFLFLIGLSTLGMGVVLYGRKWRLWQ